MLEIIFKLSLISTVSSIIMLIIAFIAGIYTVDKHGNIGVNIQSIAVNWINWSLVIYSFFCVLDFILGLTLLFR